MVLPLTTFGSLHEILGGLYNEMMPLCNKMTGVASGLAGIGALLYIAYRVWQAIARAEQIDIFPLLRPFAIGLCIMFFQPVVITTLNGVLNPISVGTRQLRDNQTFDMRSYQKQKDKIEAENMARQTYDRYMQVDKSMDEELESIIQWDDADLSAMAKMYEEQNSWGMEGIFRTILRWLLEFLFEVASLVLDTIRTFYLIVLSILGPIAFAISVFDGFQNSLVQWLQKYITVYLWLPIADLFGAMLSRIQVLSLQRDIELIQNNPFYIFDMNSTVYLVFLVIGIFGYFVIPSIASWVVQAGGFSSYNRKLTGAAGSVINYGAGALGAGMGWTGGQALGNGSKSTKQ